MLELLPVTGSGDVRPGTDLAAVIAAAAPWLADGDVLVVTSKIVSKAEGRLVDVPAGALEREAVKLSLERLMTFPFIAERVAAGTLSLEGARFGIADGELEWLDKKSGKFHTVV